MVLAQPTLTVLKMATKGESKGYDWLLAHVNHQGEDCLKWPFGGESKSGRGALKFSGARGWAHRIMCTLAHGEPPTPEHTAAHECGKGHDGCVNPRHLKWKTQKENNADCAKHGTSPKHHDGNRGRLTADQVAQIRGSRGVKTQRELAALFEVSEGAINDIWRGRSHANPSKISHWTPEETAKLKEAFALGYNIRQAAKYVGRPFKATMTYTYRIGLKSGQPIQRITDRPEFSFPSFGDRGSVA